MTTFKDAEEEIKRCNFIADYEFCFNGPYTRSYAENRSDKIRQWTTGTDSYEYKQKGVEFKSKIIQDSNFFITYKEMYNQWIIDNPDQTPSLPTEEIYLGADNLLDNIEIIGNYAFNEYDYRLILDIEMPKN